MRIGVVHAMAFPFARNDQRFGFKLNADQASGKGAVGISGRHHVVVMPHPYISAINVPHAKVMGINGQNRPPGARLPYVDPRLEAEKPRQIGGYISWPCKLATLPNCSAWTIGKNVTR